MQTLGSERFPNALQGREGEREVMLENLYKREHQTTVPASIEGNSLVEFNS